MSQIEVINTNGAGQTILTGPQSRDFVLKHDRFRRLSVPRMNQALKAIVRLGNFESSKYAYTAAECDAMLAVLHEAVDDLEAKLSKKNKQPFAWDSFE